MPGYAKWSAYLWRFWSYTSNYGKSNAINHPIHNHDPGGFCIWHHPVSRFFLSIPYIGGFLSSNSGMAAMRLILPSNFPAQNSSRIWRRMVAWSQKHPPGKNGHNIRTDYSGTTWGLGGQWVFNEDPCPMRSDLRMILSSNQSGMEIQCLYTHIYVYIIYIYI